MRLHELFLVETTAEDKELITLSSAIYAAIRPFFGPDAKYNKPNEVALVGTIADFNTTSLTGLNDIKIEVQASDPFLQRSKDDFDTDDNILGKQIHAFWEEDTRTIVFNQDHIGTNRMKTTVTHELRHALDDVKSGSYPGDAQGYFTPRKKEHRKDDPYSTIQYRASPAEINARFVEILDVMSKRIPQWYRKLDSAEIKPQLTKDFNNLLRKFEIEDIFPERTKSPDYKRLVKRAYDFMQKEMTQIETELAAAGTPKSATGSF